MIDKEYLTGVFNNIIPATFDDSVTYLEQLVLIRDKVNELIDLVNDIVESGGSGYTLPPATTEKLGGIKVGQNLTIDEDGTLNAQAGGGGGEAYELPIATKDILGGIKIGDRLTITEDGVLSADEQGGGGGEAYELPIATRERLGGIKIGEGLDYDTDGRTYIRYGKGLVLHTAETETEPRLIVSVGEGLYINEQGQVCAVIPTPEVQVVGIQDEVKTQTTQNEDNGMSEDITVNDSVNILKF